MLDKRRSRCAGGKFATFCRSKRTAWSGDAGCAGGTDRGLVAHTAAGATLSGLGPREPRWVTQGGVGTFLQRYAALFSCAILRSMRLRRPRWKIRSCTHGVNRFIQYMNRANGSSTTTALFR